MAVSNEPPKITNGGENPDNMSHWDIYNAFNPLNPGTAQTPEQQYGDIASKWSEAASFFASRIRQSSSAAWDGKAAEASRTAISNYATRAEDLTEALNALSAQVGAAKDGVSNTRNGVDVPIEKVSRLNFWDGDFLLWHGDRSLKKINEERDKAREAMKNNYVANMISADKSIPVTPKPTSPTNPLYTYTPTSGNPNSGPSNSNSNSGNQNSGNSTSSTSYSGSGSDSGSQSGTSSSDSTSPSSYQSSNASTSLSTLPSSFYSGLSSSLSTTPSSFTSGTGTGSGSGGYDGGTTTNSGGGLGKSVTGTGNTTTGTTAAAAATKAGTSSTGMAGMGGMGGANKGKGEDDADHSLPEWLRNMENTEELLGPQPKTIPGGVIGGDYEDPHAGA